MLVTSVVMFSQFIYLNLILIATIKGGNLFTSLSHVKSSDVQAIWNTVGSEREEGSKVCLDAKVTRT